MKWLLAIMLIMISAVAFGDTTTVAITIDAHLKQDAPNENNGSATSLYVTDEVSASDRVSVFIPDLSAFEGLSIDTVRIRLCRFDSVSADWQLYIAYLTEGPFVESEVTWNSYSTGNTWTTAGGSYHLCSSAWCDTADNIGTPATASQWVEFVSVDGQWLCEIVDSMANGSLNEYGFRLWHNYSGQKRFRSSDYTTDATLRPEIYISTTTGGEPPDESGSGYRRRRSF